MIYVLTDGETKYGWGRPLGVFNDRGKMKKFIEAKLKNDFPSVENTSIKTRKDDGYVIIRIDGSAKNGERCVADCCVFTFDSINEKLNPIDFFGEGENNESN